MTRPSSLDARLLQLVMAGLDPAIQPSTVHSSNPMGFHIKLSWLQLRTHWFYAATAASA